MRAPIFQISKLLVTTAGLASMVNCSQLNFTGEPVKAVPGQSVNNRTADATALPSASETIEGSASSSSPTSTSSHSTDPAAALPSDPNVVPVDPAPPTVPAAVPPPSTPPPLPLTGLPANCNGAEQNGQFNIMLGVDFNFTPLNVRDSTHERRLALKRFVDRMYSFVRASPNRYVNFAVVNRRGGYLGNAASTITGAYTDPNWRKLSEASSAEYVTDIRTGIDQATACDDPLLSCVAWDFTPMNTIYSMAASIWATSTHLWRSSAPGSDGFFEPNRNYMVWVSGMGDSTEFNMSPASPWGGTTAYRYAGGGPGSYVANGRPMVSASQVATLLVPTTGVDSPYYSTFAAPSADKTWNRNFTADATMPGGNNDALADHLTNLNYLHQGKVFPGYTNGTLNAAMDELYNHITQCVLP